MMPTPAPAPPMPMQAMPAPMYFAANGSMRKLLFEVGLRFGSVTRMDGVVEIDAGQDREHIGLEERDQQFQRGQRDDQNERQRRAEDAEDAQAPEQRDEAREHLERDVARQHVGEQAHAVRDRARQERQHLDEHDQRQDVDRDALWHEQAEEAE